MRILVVTPLYPPEVAPAAVYAKEFARRMSAHNEVAVLAYAHLPESALNVRVEAIEKRARLLPRLFAFTRALLREARRADVVFAMNGPSVELPVLFVSLVSRAAIVFGESDRAAHAYARKHFFRRALERLAVSRARAIVRDFPPPRPDILPLEPAPTAALNAYEAAWRAHLAALETMFRHGA